ncbi:Condensin complex subunit 3 [Thelohanellus kitauei]|uniref:Condensin complex subunit 3 n=1 Tax=Thelohanellus kitauei TaxID=669202 RepID=A0A0C2JND3_THEKT|nr:Condensin complex subunit 3 [Thelohanellus kitauei]
MFKLLLVDSWFLNSCEGGLDELIDYFDIIEENELLERVIHFILSNLDLDALDKILNIVLCDAYDQNEIRVSGRDQIFIFCQILKHLQTRTELLVRYSSRIPEISKICELIDVIFLQDNEDLALCQLFSVLRYYELNDEAGRKLVIELTLKLLSKPTSLSLKLIYEVVKTYVHFATSHRRTLDTIVELISEIRQPLNTSGTFTQATQRGDDNSQAGPENLQVLITCLSIVTEVLKARSLDLSTPSSTSLLQSFILPLIQDNRSDVRAEAVKCLSLFCIYVKNYAVQYLMLLANVVQFDSIEISSIAISAIFDILTLYGFSICENEENEQTVIDMLLELADKASTPDLQVILIAGMAKLFLFKRVTSAKILALLIWSLIDPTCESNPKKSLVLSQFFHIFLSEKFLDSFDLFTEACVLFLTRFTDEYDGTAASVNNLANMFSNFTKVDLSKLNGENLQPTTREKLVLALLERLVISESDEEIKIIIKVLASFNILVATQEGTSKSINLIEQAVSKLETQDKRTIKLAEKIKSCLLNQSLLSLTESRIENTTVAESI